MSKIQERDTLYDAFRPLVCWLFRHAYRQLQYVGEENIPKDGAIIYAPNHTNALQDALAVLAIKDSSKVFVARADIFRKPKVAKILTWLKIMPIRRMRDGVDEVRHNDETMDKAVETLHDGVPFCILPEGTHRPKHSLLPLSKGIFRIALRANDEFGEDKPIYIVPVGIEYGDYYHLWTSLTVNIGKPINVTQFAKEHAELERPQLILALREELTMRMREQIMWVPDDEHYEENIRKLQANPPAPFNKLREKRLPLWLSIPMLVVTAPLFLVCAVITLPLWVVWLIIRWKVKDPAFHNSVQFVWQVIIIPLTFFITLPFWIFMQEYMFRIREIRDRGEDKP